MSRGITLCIVGAGSSYTPELVEGILAHTIDELPVAALRLHDIHTERMDITASLARRMIAHAGRDISVDSGTDLEAMLEGADFVITQIRVGGMAARARDERIPLKYGVIGQETTGPGGMFKALRTIPAMLEICRTVERVVPEAFVLNYTNPSGMVTEAMKKHTNARFIGLCSGMPGIVRRLSEKLADRFPDLKVYCVGLNHLGFAYRMVSGGKDVTEEAIRLVVDRKIGTAEFARFLGAVPLSYLNNYFHHAKRVEKALAGEKTRAETIEQIEQEVFAQAADPATVTKPEALAKRGGGGYSAVTFSFLKAILNDTGAELVCTVQNGGAVDGIEHDAGVEVTCRVGKDGPEPIPVGAMPLAFRGLVQAVKAYETLTVEAAIHRERGLVVQALLTHPLVGDLDTAVPLVDEMLQAHGLDYR